VSKYELWNEPNDIHFWKSVPVSADYITWADAVYDAVKAADANATLVIGGLSALSAGGTNCLEGIPEFIPALYTAEFYADGMSIHPYDDGDPYVDVAFNNNFTDVADVRALMVAAGKSSQPLWLTEWGWDGEGENESAQALYMLRSFQLLRDTYTYVSLATWFMDEDVSPYTEGLFTDEGVKRKSARVFYEFTSLLA
jgi:hypothetical protein